MNLQAVGVTLQEHFLQIQVIHQGIIHQNVPVIFLRVEEPDHRQQERDRGRLLHPLRRHGRRLRRHQGRAQDFGLRTVGVRQPARRV